MRPIRINQSYLAQRVTGQQRYAREISRRLERSPDFSPLRPTGFWSGSALRVWAWVQLVLPLASRGSVVLSMTSRAPLWRRRHVLVVHDLFVLTNPEWYSRTYVWTHAPLLRAQISSASALVAVSRPVADQLARVCRGPVVVAPNAPSEVFRRTAADEPGSALTARGLADRSYFLAVGNRDPRKNLGLLTEAYGRLTADERRRHPLVLVGGSSAIYRSQALERPEGTIDAGYVTDDELRQLYRGARAVVFLSKAEGFGLPLVEAAAAGARGLLVSDIEVFRWICADQARYVDPTSIPRVVDGLRAEIADPQQRVLDLDRFDWDSSAATVADVCRQVSGHRVRSRV